MEISSLAKICPHCQSKLAQPTTLLTKVFLGVIVIGILTSVVLSNSGGSQSSNAPAQPSAEALEQREAVKKQNLEVAYTSVKAMADDGFLYKIEPEQYRAYVDEMKWAETTIDQKEAYAQHIGLYIQNQNGDTLGIDILGARSGVKLGEWSDYSGYKASE